MSLELLPPIPAKYAYSFAEFQQLGGPGEVTTRKLADQGKIALKHLGGRTVILRSEVERFFAELPTLTAETKRKVEPAIRGRKPRRAA